MDFVRLLKRISPILKRITYRLNGHFSFFNDEDLYQEALTHLWNDFQDGILADKTDSYILQGCYFYLKNYIRTHRDKARLVSLEASIDSREDRCLEDVLDLRQEGNQDPRNYFHNKLLTETIRNNSFSPREKEILSYCSQGLTTREIGARLGISHVRVIKLLARIKSECRKYLDNC